MRIISIITLLLIEVLSTQGQDLESHKGNPNVLLIVSEDHGIHLSCYGDTIIETPNLDKIARDGILFRNAYVTQSVCSPSRSSILTGLYPHQNGQLGLASHGHQMLREVDNIYSMLKNIGYRTGMIGKLHVNPESSFPIDYRRIRGGNFEKSSMNMYAKYADTFMNSSDKPFFLMVNYPDAHWPLQDQVEGVPSNPVVSSDVVSFPYLGLDNERLRSITANYYNCILRLDYYIGELINQLNKSEKENNTLVIYLSDHGDQMARGKYNVYEAGVKIPFLAKWPGKIQSGIESKALISSIDIVPTILDIAGQNIPGNIAGKSLVPLFSDPDLSIRDFLFVEQNADNLDHYYPRRAIRDSQYKLIFSLLQDRINPQAKQYVMHLEHKKPEWYGSPTLEELDTLPKVIRKMYKDWLYPPKVQLFDLKADPWEFNDLSMNSNYSEVKDRLLKELFVWQERTNDPLRFPTKLKALTTEHDTIESSKSRKWLYPEYLYGEKSYK